MQQKNWIEGTSKTGKTSRLIDYFVDWTKGLKGQELYQKRAIILSSNWNTKKELSDRLAIVSPYPSQVKTPLNFFESEVKLFFPLLIQSLRLKPPHHTPIRLQPELEQKLAADLWRPMLKEFEAVEVSEQRLVRRILDWQMLASTNCIPIGDIPGLLKDLDGWPVELVGGMILQWRDWCLERRFLSYALSCELYWRHLFPNTVYQFYLFGGTYAVFADDVDDYPPIARNMFEFLIEKRLHCVFTYNPDAQVRFGMGSDPDRLSALRDLCEVEKLDPTVSEFSELREEMTEILEDPFYLSYLPSDRIASISTVTRTQMLQKVADKIVELVKGGVPQGEIAIVSPGLDPATRYFMSNLLTNAGLRVDILNEQKTLVSSPAVRALLTLLTLAYPGLGFLVGRDDVAEMLILFSKEIDPVRAGIIADSCFVISESPLLLPPESFYRWDRLGARTFADYSRLREWIEGIKMEKLPDFTWTIDRAIRELLLPNGLGRDEMAPVKEFVKVAQHYREVSERCDPEIAERQVANFIIGMKRDITSNVFNPRTLFPKDAIALANIFQYRSSKSSHLYQFWIDAGSPNWERGGAISLFGFPLFLETPRQLTPSLELELNFHRLKRVVRDLAGRVREKIFLCHSDLSAIGSEQQGAMLPFLHLNETEY